MILMVNKKTENKRNFELIFRHEAIIAVQKASVLDN